MGRQLQLATTKPDEVELLRFVRSSTPIRVFQSFTPTIDELWIEDWETREIPSGGFSIWPATFPWSPEYAQTGGPGCPPERSGLFYISNTSAAPILEFTGSSLEEKRYGRIYWARDFSAPNGLEYDAESFARFVDSVWRWIRKVGHRLPDSDVYFLPDAWSLYGRVAV
jgi:hypothetical protein